MKYNPMYTPITNPIIDLADAPWRGPFGVEMAGEVLLPGPAALVAPTTFEQWLGAQRPAAP